MGSKEENEVTWGTFQEMASGLPTAAASAVDLCPLLTWGLLTT